ncbi:peptidyl-prolyl cis-trans isomerase A (rotamase A) [Candidatus Nitrosomarinus catalina]|uniref:peptidylprolyl isomerase n=1 Tax=Candidatus Nitrosomarinus catalinensis TaxID=1898749 RepID=A0A2Z2HH80_9ARCH|nr:peptidylprolyl isomerase [Candidatus Nitrosomarinus catalina]ARS63641.1 peptidyl-prolyl cis-trans isomerase A (rotamase A) [Candidatus Nitrosomarinus catalina]
MKKILLTLIFSLFIVTLTNYAFAQHYEDPLVVLETTQGEIIIELFHIDAPNHSENFLLLSKTGYYDGILFHRIIPGFMIQSGDPNSINGDPNTWGQGGNGSISDRINAEFNNIKHDRGIVSMARAQDPNSAGSQFFIVHKDSHFLDEQYTVFGRIVTESSFETLDKIAAVQTGTNDRPTNPEQVRIIKTTLVERSEISNIMNLSEPSRTGSTVTGTPEFTIFENQDLDVKFTVPVGWMLQQPPKSSPDSPDIVAVGALKDGFNPNISLTIKEATGKTMDDLIFEKNQILDQAVYLNKLEILNQEKIKSNVYQTEAIANFVVNDVELKIKFIEAMILNNEKLYTFAYSNTVENFDNDFSKFNDSLNSFEIISQQSSESKSAEGNIGQQTEEGGGCLIATATYGSEMSQQVQQLRELRDNQLLQTESGKQFMGAFNDVYYSFSPVIADYERENPLFKEAVKIAITPMISTLSLMENAETELEVLGLGLSVITLNIGMYLGIPAIIIFGIKKRN